MADFNPVFEIDVSKILAKLHAAGQQQVPNSNIINTGIKKNNKSATPENIGDMTFELNKTGEYQLAVVKLIQYRIPIDLQKQKDIVKINDELVKLGQPSIFDNNTDKDNKDKEDKEDKDSKSDKKDTEKKDDKADAKKEEADKKTSLTDPNALKKTEVKDSIVHVKSFLEFLTEDKDDDKDDKNKDKIDKLHKDLLNIFDALADFKVNEKDADAEDTKDGMQNFLEKYKRNDEDFDLSLKSFLACLAEENKHRNEYRLKMYDELKGGCLADFKTYFLTFAGKDNVAKVDANKITLQILDLTGDIAKDPKNAEDIIKDGKIEVGKTFDEAKAEEEGMQEKEPNHLFSRSLACAVGYEVDVD